MKTRRCPPNILEVNQPPIRRHGYAVHLGERRLKAVDALNLRFEIREDSGEGSAGKYGHGVFPPRRKRALDLWGLGEGNRRRRRNS